MQIRRHSSGTVCRFGIGSAIFLAGILDNENRVKLLGETQAVLNDFRQVVDIAKNRKTVADEAKTFKAEIILEDVSKAGKKKS